MRIIQCPDRIHALSPCDQIIFMAGGITGCPDWQSMIIAKAKNIPCNITLVNPRRNISVNATTDKFQIEWEHEHLAMASKVYFWFPKEGNCIITLFELGCMLGQKKPIRVGVEPGYIRSFDVYEQLCHYAPNIKIHESLDTLYDRLLNPVCY